jgi:ceramide glucosyltransferase
VTAAVWALDALLVTAAGYSVAVSVIALRFRHRRAPGAGRGGTAPNVSILVPLAGAEPGLDASLDAYCRLEHAGAVQLVVGSIDPEDAALTVAEDVARRYPEADVRIVAGVPATGPNRKAALLAALADVATHPVLSAIDSDVRVGPDYLRRLLPELARPGVGLVTCYYRAPRPRTLAEAYEALSINTDFVPAAMLASACGRADVAFGASLMLRRTTLDAVGGFAAVVHHLADDHRLAELVRAHGESVAVAPYVVESDPHPATLVAALRHQLRWARTVRSCAPWGYTANVVTHGTTFALVSVLPVAHLALHRLVLAAVVVVLRQIAAILGSRALGGRLGWGACLVPARDLAATLVWVASFVGDRIEWRGRYYRLARDGRLTAEGLVRDAAPAAATASSRRPVGESLPG